jgi:transcriptional regulator with XRE-family HTH domain
MIYMISVNTSVQPVNTHGAIFYHIRVRWMTGEQLRAARAMLKIEQAELAQLSGVSLETIKRLERMNGFLSANTKTLASLERVLEQEGAVFIPENGGLSGVRLRRDPPPKIRTRRRRGEAGER